MSALPAQPVCIGHSLYSFVFVGLLLFGHVCVAFFRGVSVPASRGAGPSHPARMAGWFLLRTRTYVQNPLLYMTNLHKDQS